MLDVSSDCAWLSEIFSNLLTFVAVVMNVLAFVGFSIALLAKAPKASGKFVFVDVINKTGLVSCSYFQAHCINILVL